MFKLTAIVGFLFAIFSAPSIACHRITPDRTSLDRYTAVFLGQVTGIHLVGYENAIAGRPDGFIGGKPFNVADGSETVEVSAVPSKVARGNPDKSVQIRLVGCTAPLPALKERGLFFVNLGGDSAVTVWESDSKAFTFWLERLGLTADGR
jgi:hypothetical protein